MRDSFGGIYKGSQGEAAMKLELDDDNRDIHENHDIRNQLKGQRKDFKSKEQDNMFGDDRR